MIPFCIVMLVVLVMIIAIWNHVTDFKTAYLQSYAFLLVVMNWFDDIVKRSAATDVFDYCTRDGWYCGVDGENLIWSFSMRYMNQQNFQKTVKVSNIRVLLMDYAQ